VDVLNAEGGELLGPAEEPVRIVDRVRGSTLDGDPDVVEVAAFPVAVPAKDFDLSADLIHLDDSEVARVGVLRHEAERLSFAAAPNADRRPRAADRTWAVERLGELVMPSLVRAVVVAPHLQAYLQRLLKALEPFG